EYTFTFFSGLPADDKKILLNFPLYCGVKEVLIGLDADASLRTPPSFSQKGRVVVYGTSITQGGCASRPGMAYSNLLSRRLGIEFINFGFSGNGNGEPEVAALVSSVADARLFILDYEANAGLCGTLEQTFDDLIDAVRGAYAHIPILVLSMPKVSSLMYSEKERGQMEKRRAFMQKNIADRTQKGDDRLFFLSGETLLGDDWHECTVDGMHPNDLGFYRIAQALAKPIVALLRQNESKGEEK
ncbi:MAG: SGNH/GDSL hydrolase family protein, partial [Ruthenibacterium sp.]